MAELAEEYSRLTKKILKYSIFGVLAIHVLLMLFDGFPIFTTMFGIALHGVYYQFLKDFPFVNFSSPMFIGACGTGSYFSSLPSFLPSPCRFPPSAWHPQSPFRFAFSVDTPGFGVCGLWSVHRSSAHKTSPANATCISTGGLETGGGAEHLCDALKPTRSGSWPAH
eukprot:1069617-Rhodomonas_salina.2